MASVEAECLLECSPRGLAVLVMPNANYNIPIGNGFDFKLRGFRDGRVNPLSGEYLNAATTHTWEIRTESDGGGTQVAAGSLDYVTGSNGDYFGGPSGSEDLDAGVVYWATLVLVQGVIRVSFNFAIEAVRRTGSNQST